MILLETLRWFFIAAASGLALFWLWKIVPIVYEVIRD